MSAFEIEVSDNLIRIQTPKRKSRLSLSNLPTLIFSWLLGSWTFSRTLPLFGSLLRTHHFDILNWLLAIAVAFFGAAMIWQGFRIMFPRGESLVCNKETLTIGRIPNFVLSGRWEFQSFPVSSVKQLTWTALSTGRYGNTTGLTFQVDGKKKKTLWGLEAPEADQVLRGLTKLGVDVVHDPGMPMIVEMAVSRRKSLFGKLLN